MAKLTGFDEFRKALRAWPQEVRKEVGQALEKNAVELTQAQKALVPEQSGELRESIKWKPYSETKPKRIMGVRVTAGDHAGDGFYSRWVEFGTAPGAHGRGSTAQPFFYPPYRALNRRFKGRITRAINKGTKKIAGT